MARAGTTAGGSRGSVTCRGRAIITAACVSVLLAACGSASTAGGRPSATGPGGAATAAESAVTTAAPSPAPAGSPAESFDLMDLSGPGFGLAGLGTGQAGGYARLVASADSGRSFTAIGPRTAAWTATDDVFFLGRQDGWFAVFNVNTLAETLYRTTDGGRTWHGYAAPAHNMAAGSSDIVQFLTPARGWLVSTEANAPAESLYSTTDGGISWHLVASLRTAHGSGILPELGQVWFEPGGRAGWLGGGLFSRALYRTGDGGRTWRQASIPAPAGSQFGLPAGSGRTLLEPVTLCSGALVLYRSTDGGTRWSQVSALPGATTAAPACGPATVSVSFPSLLAGWATAVRAARTVIYRTTDGGRRWEEISSSWKVPPDTDVPPVIQGIDATHAWLLTPGSARVYATVNGGTTWRRIDTAAIAAGS
jgi:photosystem II stability/assembly factor-like uncharacterized protein